MAWSCAHEVWLPGGILWITGKHQDWPSQLAMVQHGLLVHMHCTLLALAPHACSGLQHVQLTVLESSSKQLPCGPACAYICTCASNSGGQHLTHVAFLPSGKSCGYQSVVTTDVSPYYR